MKKILLSLSLVVSLGASAQVLDSEDFTNFQIGNVGTDVSGATTGQGGFYTANGVVTDYQIVADDVAHGNVLQMTGSSTNTSTRYLWKGDFAEIWDFRDAGNNILEAEYDFFTGPVSTSKNSMSLLIFDTAGTKILAGLSFQMDTKIIQGVAYYDASAQPGGSIANYNFRLGATANIVLAANTWVRIGCSFNKTTGEVKWRGPGFNGFVPGAAANSDAGEADFMASPNYAATPANAAAGTVKFDNYRIRAVATDGLLAVNQIATAATAFTVFPNPANDVINVSNTNNVNVNKITVTDLNGRVVKEVNYSNTTNIQVNVSDLSSGVYMMNINSDKGSSVQKIIKN